MGETTTIRVKGTTRDRLHQLAADADCSMSDYLDQLAGTQRTQAEWDALAEHDRATLREHFGFDPTAGELAEMQARHATIMADLEAQYAVRARRGRPASA